MALRVTDEMIKDIKNIGYEGIIKSKLGYNFKDLIFEYHEVDNLTVEALGRKIKKYEVDAVRVLNNIKRNKISDEPLPEHYYIKHDNKLSRYVTKLKQHMEKCDKQIYCDYVIAMYDDLTEFLSYKYEELKLTSVSKSQEYAGEETTCECGAKVTKGNFARHRLTKKHLDNMPLNKGV